jgi:asparagine synthase (glutamine-hydrolysing)
MRKEARIYEFLNPEAVQAFVGEHMSGQKNRRLFIWSLLNLEALLDQ